MNKYLGSSANPNKVSMTVKGVLLAVVAVLASFGINTAELELNSLIDAVINSIDAIMGAVSAIMVLYGLGRKIYFKFFDKAE